MRFLEIPSIERLPWGIVCLVLNLIPIVPGIGSIVAGVKGSQMETTLAGILQGAIFLLGFIFAIAAPSLAWLVLLSILAWLWSIVWGVRILLRSA